MSRGAQWQALGAELTAFSFVAAFFGKRHGGEGLGVAFAVEVVVHVPGIKGSVEGTEAGSEAKTLLYPVHEREEIGDIRLVEGLRQLGQDELAPAGHLDDDDARAVSPIELANPRIT